MRFNESLGLRPKYSGEVLGTVAGIELAGEGMGVQTFSRHPLILVAGCDEYSGKGIGGRASCLIARGHNGRDSRGDLGGAQVVG